MKHPALWAIQAGIAKPQPWAPMWVRRGKTEALRILSRAIDLLDEVRREELTRPKRRL